MDRLFIFNMNPRPPSDRLTPVPTPEAKLARLHASLAEVRKVIETSEFDPAALLRLDRDLRGTRASVEGALHPEHRLYNRDATRLAHGVRKSSDFVEDMIALDPTLSDRFMGETTGNPQVYGWDVPPLLREMLRKEIEDPQSFAYCHSFGDPKARELVCQMARDLHPESTLHPDNVLFTNGVAHAIALLLEMVNPRLNLRLVQPNPTYPSFPAFETLLAEDDPLFYKLDPEKEWNPDIDSLEQMINDNPNIFGILLIHPNNPTGGLYDENTLRKIVEVAERNKKMIICDEIYQQIILNGNEYVPITKVAHGRVPLAVIRGTSKDIPWPGARSGWIEFHNTELDQDYRKYVWSVKERMRAEVCATSLPQRTLGLYRTPEFATWLEAYRSELQGNVEHIASILEPVKGIKVTRPKGAFYMFVTFDEGVLNDRQSLPLDGVNAKGRDHLHAELSTPNLPLDKRFVLNLAGSGHNPVRVIAASDFSFEKPGFRTTALERNPEKRDMKFRGIARGIEEYLDSAK